VVVIIWAHCCLEAKGRGHWVLSPGRRSRPPVLRHPLPSSVQPASKPNLGPGFAACELTLGLPLAGGVASCSVRQSQPASAVEHWRWRPVRYPQGVKVGRPVESPGRIAVPPLSDSCDTPSHPSSPSQEPRSPSSPSRIRAFPDLGPFHFSVPLILPSPGSPYRDRLPATRVTQPICRLYCADEDDGKMCASVQACRPSRTRAE